MNPFLLLIMAKILGGLMRSGIFSRYRVGNEQVEVAFLQFANGTLFFVEANINNVMETKAMLGCYEFIFDLKVNFYKSCLAGIMVDEACLSRYAKMLNCVGYETSISRSCHSY